MGSLLLDKPEWVPDESVTYCTYCEVLFSFLTRKHHCRGCGRIFCGDCSDYKTLLNEFGYTGLQRVCISCYTSHEQKEQINNELLIARFYLRHFSSYKYTQYLKDVGSRKGKIYSLITDNAQPKAPVEYILTTLPFYESRVKIDGEPMRRTLLKLLRSISKHPFIAPLSSSDYLMEKERLVIMREKFSQGSLKDYMRQVKRIDRPYVKKYSQIGQPLSLPMIAKFGRQILEVLAFFKALDLPFHHLHSCNLMIKGNNCFVSDIENALLCYPSQFYYPHLKDIGSYEVFCFGQILFEMVSGYNFFQFDGKSSSNPNANNINHSSFVGSDLVTISSSVTPNNSSTQIPSCNPELKEILTKILFPSDSSEVVTIESLLKYPLFANAPLDQKPPKLKHSFDERTLGLISSIKYSYFPSLAPSVTPAPTPSTSSTPASSTNAPPSNSTSTSTPSERKGSRIDAKKKLRQDSKSSLKTSTVTASGVPPPPPPGAPPPPPKMDLPKPQEGRGALLDSIRNPDNIKKLKHVK